MWRGGVASIRTAGTDGHRSAMEAGVIQPTIYVSSGRQTFRSSIVVIHYYILLKNNSLCYDISGKPYTI